MARYNASVTVRMTPSLRRQLAAQAKRERRSLASVCRRMLASQVRVEDDQQPCLAFAPACPHAATYVVKGMTVCVACQEKVSPSRAA